MPRATRGFTITSSTCTPARARGNASCRRSIPLSWWAGCWQPQRTSTGPHRPRARSVTWPSVCMREWIGSGPKTAALYVTSRWKPEGGFSRTVVKGTTSACCLYVLGSRVADATPSSGELPGGRRPTVEDRYEPSFSTPAALHAPTLSHLDRFRGIQDAFMRQHGIDYFENSRRATMVHQQYAIRKPRACPYAASSAGASRERRPGNVPYGSTGT